MQLDPTRGSEIRKTRPCVVLTNDVLNLRRRTVVVVPFSTAPAANPPILVAVCCAGKPSVAVTDQIRAIAKERLVERLGTLSNDELQAVEDGVREILNL